MPIARRPVHLLEQREASAWVEASTRGYLQSDSIGFCLVRAREAQLGEIVDDVRTSAQQRRIDIEVARGKGYPELFGYLTIQMFLILLDAMFA